MDWTSGIFALAGVIVGGGVNFITQSAVDRRKRKADRESVAAALSAEIEAYLDIVERRRNIESARAVLLRLQNGESIPLRGFGVERDEKSAAIFPAYLALLPQLGLLGGTVSKVTKFYSLAMAVRSTARTAERGGYEHLDCRSKAKLLEDELAIWDELSCLGRALAKQLRPVTA